MAKRTDAIINGAVLFSFYGVDRPRRRQPSEVIINYELAAINYSGERNRRSAHIKENEPHIWTLVKRRTADAENSNARPFFAFICILYMYIMVHAERRIVAVMANRVHACGQLRGKQLDDSQTN